MCTNNPEILPIDATVPVDVNLDFRSVNGQIIASKFKAKAFVEVLQFVKWIGEEVNSTLTTCTRPAYIYSTAVRDPKNDAHAVGVIQIVFDAEPQFRAMLTDTLPKNEKKQIMVFQ